MGNCYKAQEASYQSGKYVCAGDREGWLSLFADDAVVQDPVGESPLDPTGQGHKGREGIGGFWDMVIGPGKMEKFEITSSHPCGDECANVVEIRNVLGDTVIEQRMVVVYTANDAGKLVSLKAYWDYNALQEKLAEAG